MDAGCDRTVSASGVKARGRAKEVCEQCPLSVAWACRAWALREERPRGGWVGVWGGLDPWERTGRRLLAGEKGRIDAVLFTIGGPDDLLGQG